MNTGSQNRANSPSTTAVDREVESQAASVTTKIAHGIEELMQAFAIRAAVFLSELACPYTEEFDGNDFTSTHFLGYVGREPASTCRVRYFSGFAKLERVAVRQEFRKTGVGSMMIAYALETCRQKGYSQVHGHCEKHLLPFWQKFGFEPIEADSFTLLGHEYIQIECVLEPHPDPIKIGIDPMTFIRPEGAWDEPCSLELGSAKSLGDDSDSHWSTELKRRMDRLG